MKTLSVVFGALAVLLSDVMCAAVAYNYCALQWNPATSFPPYAAFLLAIPYAVGIAVCAALAVIFHLKAKP